MSKDEQLIRETVATWMAATAVGDLEVILDLMTEDVIFIQPGQEPMRGRQAFAEGFRTAIQHFCIEGSSEIQEIQVSGDQAYCWNQLSITLVPLKGGASMRREGPVLSVFRKGLDGKWRIFRDANMLTGAKTKSLEN